MGYGYWSRSYLPQSALDVANAFWEGREIKRSNCRTEIVNNRIYYHLAGSSLAIRFLDLPAAFAEYLRDGSYKPHEPKFTMAGWNKAMTHRHLRALGVECDFRPGGVALMNGKAVNCGAWYALADLEAMPDWKPLPPPAPRPKSVNNTLPLFA